MCLEVSTHQNVTLTNNQQLSPSASGEADVKTQETWDEILRKEGLSMEAGRSSYLLYGYNDVFKEVPIEQTHKVVTKPRKPTARMLAKAAVWRKPKPEIEEPEWGYAGGYTPEARRVRVNPGIHRNRKIKEEALCAQIALVRRAS